jgi:hypothetical protein
MTGREALASLTALYDIAGSARPSLNCKPNCA